METSCSRSSGTELGKAASAIIAAGELVGDDLINPMVANRLAQPDCASGFLLDGYPRTLPQAEYLSGLLSARGMDRLIAIHIDVPASAILARITSRRQCPQCGRIYNVVSQPPRREGICDHDGAPVIRRADDTEEVITRRLEAYAKATGPVVDYYARRGAHTVDGNRAPEEIWREIKTILQPLCSAAGNSQ
ncbi:MAG: nucleoside monophosphate kinase [Acidobacteria bacterium]|nr:nucleoside monophosphate kinase [Acidobacteriota bacterium]